MREKDTEHLLFSSKKISPTPPTPFFLSPSEDINGLSAHIFFFRNMLGALEKNGKMQFQWLTRCCSR